MHETILVSVLIPVYNAEKYIAHTLDSVCAQTHRNIEIIVQDNASSDLTRTVVENRIIRDNRITLFRNTENIGYVRNIMSLVEHAKSEIICIFHADDLYSPEIIESELATLLSSGAAAVFVRYKEFRHLRGRLTPHPIMPILKKKKAFFSGSLNDYAPLLLTQGNPFCCPSLMTRRTVFLECGGFTDEFPSNEDMDLWLRFLINGHQLAIVNSFLLSYRRTNNQGSAYWAHISSLPTYFEVLEKDLLPYYTLSKYVEKGYRANRARGYLWAYNNAWKAGDIPKAKMLLSLSQEEYRYKIHEGIWFLIQSCPTVYRLFKTLRTLLS